MFVLTMGKNALRRAGAAIACMACIAGVLAAADRLGGGTVTTGASAQARIGPVQETAGYFPGMGLEGGAASYAHLPPPTNLRLDVSASAEQ